MKLPVKSYWVPLSAVALLGVFGLVWFGALVPGPEEPEEPTTDEAVERALDNAADAPAGPEEDAGEDETRPPLPASLEGTEEPKGWRADADGNWEVTPALRNLFDYYLTALGEAPLDELVGHIREALSELPEEARREAKAVLRDYLDYRIEMDGIEDPMGESGETPGPEEMAARLSKIRDLRRETMGDTVTEAFFAREEALNDYALERARIQADESLSGEAREQRLADAEAQLPESMRESRQASRDYRNYRERLEAIESGAADTESIDALRAEQFGEEGAERLAEVDRQREDWDRRVSRYREDLAALRNEDISQADFQAEREVLRERYFEEGGERTRIRALDRMNENSEEGTN